MSNLSHSMKMSELQSNSSLENNLDSNFSSLMLEKESNEKEFMDVCEKINSQIVEAREEIQSLMIRSSAFCATVGTKTESVVFPSKSPRHRISPHSISNSFSLFTSTTNMDSNALTPRKSNLKNDSIL